MLNVSQAWKDNIYAGTEKKIQFTIGNTVLTDDDIQGKVEIQEACTNSEDIKIGSCIASTLKFNVTNTEQNIDFINNDISVQTSMKIPATGNFESVPLGIFLLDNIDDKDERVFKITCRDRMKLFDKDCTEFLATRTYPITLWNLTQQLCDYVGIQIENTSIVNGNYVIDNNFNAMDVTGQQILSWIGEVAASFINVNRYGKLVFKMFTATPETFTYFYGAQPTEIELIKEIEAGVTSRDYINITAAKYTVPQITRLQVAVQDDDLGVFVGTGNITYAIINNPLLYTKSEAQIMPVMQNILTKLQSIPVYTPAKLYGKGNPAIETGDIISVSTVKGQEINVLVMDRKFVYQKSFRDTYESFGTASVGEKRIVQSNVIQLKGKMNILTRSLEENRIKVIDLEIGYNEITQTVGETKSQIADINGNINTITQTISSLVSKIEDAEGNISTLEQSVNSMTSRIQTAEGDISTLQQTSTNLISRIETAEGNISILTQNANSLTSRISTAEGDISAITQTANSLESRISGAEGNITSIKQTTDDIALAVGNSKLVFDADGLTVKDGGFKILQGSTEIFKINTNGLLYLRGEFRTGRVSIINDSIWIQNGTNWDGTPSGGRIYFDTSNSRMTIQATGWSVLIRTSQLQYLLNGNSRHEFTGNVNIQGDLSINNEKYVKTRLSAVNSYDWVLCYKQ